MSRFDHYKDAYSSVAMERRDGILTMRLHTDGGPLQWGAIPHKELPSAFLDVAQDSRNLVVVLMGTGDEFSGQRGFTIGEPGQLPMKRPDDHSRLSTGSFLIENLLRIQVPVIGVVNGPAWRHAELPLLSDIVLAADDALFQDSSHFINGLPPGDGQHVLLPMAIGITRARYYLLTGQVLTAQEALRIGLVNEVLPREDLAARAQELAQMLLRQSAVVLKNTRLILVEQVKRRMVEYLDHGNALEHAAIPYAPEVIEGRRTD